MFRPVSCCFHTPSHPLLSFVRFQVMAIGRGAIVIILTMEHIATADRLLLALLFTGLCLEFMYCAPFAPLADGLIL